MKSPRPIALVSFLLIAGTLWASEAIKEDFEDGKKPSNAGWIYVSGDGALDDFTISRPQSRDNRSAGCLLGKPDGRDVQIWKPFSPRLAFTASKHTISYVAKLVPQPTGSDVHRVSFGVRTESGKGLPLFGVAENHGSRAQFQFQVADSLSAEYFPAGHLYALRLQIDTGDGLAKATGHLEMRDLTRGDKDWNTVEGLDAVPLNLEGPWDPKNWEGWLIRSSFRREIDDLAISAS